MKANKNHKTYAVTLRIHSGEYEKHNRMLINAPNIDKAGHYACYAESHFPDAMLWEWRCAVCSEPDDSFAYSVDRVAEVPDNEIPVLRKHLSYMIYDSEDLAKCGNYLEEII